MSDNEDDESYEGSNASENEESDVEDERPTSKTISGVNIKKLGEIEQDDDDIEMSDDENDIEIDDDGEDDDDAISLENEDNNNTTKNNTQNNTQNKNNGIDNDNNEDTDDDDNENEGEEDEEEDENYLQKFNENLDKEFIMDYHQECKVHNYDEVMLSSIVVRDENNIIIDDLHKTLPILTKYEKTKILGLRAVQINNGAKPLVKVPANIIDGYLIALMELQAKKIPFIIKRPVGRGHEFWKVGDLENVLF